MICTYCRSENGSEDHRCSRCGRRLTDDAPRRHFPVQTSAAAPALDTELFETSFEPAHETPFEANCAPVPIPNALRPQLVPLPVPEANATRSSAGAVPSLQAPLFPLQEVPRTMTSRPVKQAPMHPAPSMRRKAARAAQPSLFDTTYEGSRTLATSVEASVCCDAAVAECGDRIFAAAVDTLAPLFGLALFFGAFYWIAGTLTLDMKTLPWFGGVLASLMLLYRITWCLGGVDTPGMQAANLRLLSLDGRVPTKRARACRIAGGLVSLVALGIGLAWGLLDEERLTWHDHMSSTFPTRRP